jgi:hypothetical protein
MRGRDHDALLLISVLTALTMTSCSSAGSATVKACNPPVLSVAGVEGRKFESVIKLSPFGDGQFWYLQDDLLFHPVGEAPEIVPKGFVTDFASIPSVLWPVLPSWQRYGPAAIVHDYLYWSQHVSRRVADEYLLRGMRDMRVGRVRQAVIYRTLRLVGGFAWESNRKKRVGGDRKCSFQFNRKKPGLNGRHLIPTPNFTLKLARPDFGPAAEPPSSSTTWPASRRPHSLSRR